MKPCIACRKRLPHKPLFVLENAPASAQNIPDEINVIQDQGVRLTLYQCHQCGLVQFDCAPVSYYRDVIRAGGFSTTMTELRRKQYAHMIEAYHLEGKRFLEVGCGRGEFLKVLTEFPVVASGIEHRKELVEMGVKDGLMVTEGFPEQGDTEIGPMDVFLSFNFLEHQPHPDTMLQAIYHNLSEDGMGLITVPSLEYILERGSYYELISDHIAYYTFNTLGILLERNGFLVLEKEMVNQDTIAMIVRKNPDWTGVSTRKDQVVIPVDMGLVEEGYHCVCKEMELLKKTLEREGKKLGIWGASHQGFTLASTSGIQDSVEYIIDSAPFKQGRFAPASHLPIVAPEHFFQDPVDVILIVAPGYTDEIRGVIRQQFGEAIQILTLRTDRIEVLD